MIRARGERFGPQVLFGSSVSAGSAVRCAYRATAEVEPNRPRRGGSFPTKGSAKDRSLRFVFSPAPTVNWCLVERLAPTESQPVSLNVAEPPHDLVSVAVAKSAIEKPLPLGIPQIFAANAGASGFRSPGAQASSFVDAFRLATPVLPERVFESTRVPRRLELTLTPTRVTEEGISVRVRSFRVLGRSVRARVTVTNVTAKPKLIGYFTLHVNGQVLRARPDEPTRHRAHCRKRQLKPDTFLINREATGVLVFPRPRVGGEAKVRPRMVMG
jgi:hypothetical protein